jgi:hypothetical protein
MRSPRVRAQVLKDLEAVARRLASTELTHEARLHLLRRQAELGDIRDEIAEQARRAAH